MIFLLVVFGSSGFGAYRAPKLSGDATSASKKYERLVRIPAAGRYIFRHSAEKPPEVFIAYAATEFFCRLYFHLIGLRARNQ
jgi:hypothetical protein